MQWSLCYSCDYYVQDIHKDKDHVFYDLHAVSWALHPNSIRIGDRVAKSGQKSPVLHLPRGVLSDAFQSSDWIAM